MLLDWGLHDSHPRLSVYSVSSTFSSSPDRTPYLLCPALLFVQVTTGFHEYAKKKNAFIEYSFQRSCVNPKMNSYIIQSSTHTHTVEVTVGGAGANAGQVLAELVSHSPQHSHGAGGRPATTGSGVGGHVPPRPSVQICRTPTCPTRNPLPLRLLTLLLSHTCKYLPAAQ